MPFDPTQCVTHMILSSFLSIRRILHSIPDTPPAEDLSRVSGQSADLLRQLSVSHSWFCGGAFQSYTGFHTRDFLQDQRYKPIRSQTHRSNGDVLKLKPDSSSSSFPLFFVSVLHEVEEDTVEFSWKRNRLFNHTACLVLYQICMEVCAKLMWSDAVNRFIMS